MMKRIYIFMLLAVSMMLSAARAWGAAITMADLPYLCDFEDKWENRNWVLNPAVDQIITTNAWVIGKTAAYTGEQAMYVSQDGGATQTYAATNNVLLAYRDITLEAGDYDVAYDWRGMGNKTKGYLKIVYASRPTGSIKCIGNSAEPDWVRTAVQLTGTNERLEGADNWFHIQARITIPVAQANKTTTRLFFVWVNTDVTPGKDQVLESVAIDNFQLAKASPNDYPTNLHVNTFAGKTTVTWDGTSESYEVMYRKRGGTRFDEVMANGNTVTLTNVEYGAYEFWICGVNGEDKTVYSVFPTVYLYETDCFDVLNMYGAEFEYGTWTRTAKTIKGTDRIDYGPEDIRSRHTTHFDLNEVDPRTVIKNSRGDTLYCLKTVPKGEFGSVRLGNWNTGSEYESMTFHYTVESSSMAVLLINYAMVLENPDHTAVDQPRFTLEVLDEEGEPIDDQCASVDFHAPTSQEWERIETRAIWHEVNEAGKHVHWQDWKTIGLSLEDYVGKTLTIILTSYDCDQGGHFGYCYFMLNCVRSDVDGLPWGSGSSTQVFTAPQGFDYSWFNRLDTAFKDTITNTDPSHYPYLADNGRTFYVQESDTNTYLCHAAYPTNADCGYWFEASAKPHNPKAELDIRWTPKDCKNGYTWWNRCHVILTNQLTGEVEHRYDKQMEICYLLLTDGTSIPIGYEPSGTYVPMPDEGGRVRYGVRTEIFLNDELFWDEEWYDILIPEIGPLETHLYDTICRGQEVVFPPYSREKCTEPGTYLDSLISHVTGCDSVVSLHLWVHEPIRVDAYDTICPDHTYSFAGRQLMETGVYSGVFESQVTHCDSVVTLYLTEALQPTVSIVDSALCSDAPLVFDVTNSFYARSLRVQIEGVIDTTDWMRRDDAQTVIRLANKDIGLYKAVTTIAMPWCETVWVDTLTYFVTLASNVIELHWDKMLVFLSEEYNGGLTFLSYKWYRNGELMEGEDRAFIYDENLDLYATYTAYVTLLLPDGTQTETYICPFVPATLDVDDVSTDGHRARKILRNGKLIIQCNGQEFDARGRRIDS